MVTTKNIAVKNQGRLNVRLSADIKERIAKAATILGQDLTEFAVSTLNQRAIEIIETDEQMLLGSDDHCFFLDALSQANSVEPSARSKSVAEKYKRGQRKGVRFHIAD